MKSKKRIVKKLSEEFASGAVIYRRDHDGIRYLLIYSKRNRCWGFPKGHIDDGEDISAAARREVREETGLRDVTLRKGFEFDEVYEAVSHRGRSKGKRIRKHVRYFLAKTDEHFVEVDGEEIGDYAWLSFDTADSFLRFKGQKMILDLARKFINKEKGKR